MFGLTKNAYSKENLIAMDTRRASVTMIGSRIDMVYENTSHHGNIVSLSSRLYKFVIRLGKPVYDLLVPPLLRGSARRDFYADGCRG